MIFYIMELRTGKIHKRTINDNISIRYQVEGQYITIRSYYAGNLLHRYNIKKYGSVRFWVE